MKKLNLNLNLSLSLVLIATVALISSSCITKPQKEGVNSVAELRGHFADPPSEYRSAPLWDWNEQITEEGIRFQMKEFNKAGIGGVFVHPRPGLLTEYLSDEWFNLFDYTVQVGKELGMKVWIYDENSYPSGFAGGHVPAQMPDSYKHGSGLRMYKQDNLDVFPSDDIEVVLKKNGEDFIDITKSMDQEKGKIGEYFVFERSLPRKSPWYGGYSYVDLLYQGVTDKFMEVTMTKGYERNKTDFGQTLMGVFTDEPNLEAALGRGSVMRWTPELWDIFEQKWGYSLKEQLPSLVEEIGDWKKVRHDYYELLLELFADRWAKPWSNYCDDNNLLWTGHYWEHGWPEPTHGFDEAAFYIWHQMPGVDMLGNTLDTLGYGGQFGNDRAVRELRSAANQAGRKRTLSETYGGAGWELDFEEQKRLVDWQCVLGVNFVNQHLSYYSLNGVRKFDYPPSFSYHEPWWDNYKVMGDYIGRISLATSAGEQINNTLVLQPTTSSWMYFSRNEKNPNIDRIRRGFKNLVYRLEQLHVEYDLGSEYVMDQLGSAEGKRLVVGERSYDLVVIPAEMENMDKNTLSLLKKYLENGGKVLSLGMNVSRVNGSLSDQVKQLANRYPENWKNISDLYDPIVIDLLMQDDFTIDDISKNGMLYHQRRMLDDGQLLYVVNSHKSKKSTSKIRIEGKHVVYLDALTGKELKFDYERDGNTLVLDLTLEPAGSAMFLVSDDQINPEKSFSETKKGQVIQALDKTRIERETDNIMMVNYMDLKTAESEKKDIYFMSGLNELFKEKGVDIGNPWQHKIQYKTNYLDLDTMFSDGSGFTADYHFEIDKSVESGWMKTMRGVIERSELMNVKVNGKEVKPNPDEYWIESEFKTFAIGEHLKKGMNTISVSAERMHILAEPTPVYVLGDFSVVPGDRGFKITDPATPDFGSWKENGLPFYSQDVDYIQNYRIDNVKVSEFKVKLDDWAGTVAEVWVNGSKGGVIAWPPYELDVSEMMKAGDNEITVKVIGSLKNTFGFFYRDNNKWIHGPHDWNYAPKEIPGASEYFLMDYGLNKPFSLISQN